MEENYPEILEEIRETKDLTAETEAALAGAVQECQRERRWTM